MTSLNSNNSFPGATLSGEVVWNGPDIACLGICKGQSLNKVMYIIATKICELNDPYDLSSLTLQGALDIFNREESGNRTIASVLQLCLDNEVGLKVLIDNLQNKVDTIGNDNFVINLRCLASTDSFGNQVAYTRDTVIQLLVNELCVLVSDYDSLSGRVGVVENQINDILNTPKVIEENSITTCIATNKPVSQSVILLSGDYCNYKGIVGQNTQIQSALAMQPSDLTTALGSVSGWVTMPAALAQSMGNAWIAIANLHNRLSTIENTCCKADCEDIHVGYEITLSTDGQSITLRFTTTAGTSIPAGVEDKGSVLKISDSLGNTLSYNIVIRQGGETDDLSITGLDNSHPLILELTAKLGSAAMGTCTKCIPSRSVVTGTNCPVCLVTAGISKTNFGSATIVYQSGVTYQSVQISAGGQVYLPSGAKVVGIDNPNNLILSSDCVDLDNISQFQCYGILSVQQNDTGGHTEPWQQDNVGYNGIILDGSRIMFPTRILWSETVQKLGDAFKALPNVGMLFKDFVFHVETDSLYGTKVYILFRTLPDIADKLELIASTGIFFAGSSSLEYRLPAYDRDTFVSMGNSNVPDCPTGSSLT